MTAPVPDPTRAETLAGWWETFDGPAYPTGAEFAAAFLASDWLREDRARTWDAAVEEAHACGWLHDAARDDTLARNPHRAEATR